MLNNLRFHINLYRRWRHWKNAKCVFVHVPKAAGTSVNTALYGRTLGHYSISQIKSAFPKLIDDCFTFSLVRNPWDRALSAYRFASVGRTESMGVYRPEQYHVPEFDSFERFVCDWLPVCDLAKSDFIFRPQYLFVCDNHKRIMVNHVGYVERLGETVSFLEHRLGRTLDVKTVNATSSGDKSYREAYVNSEMVDIVQSVYADDIALFGYDF